jgi:hypothetical protein
MLHMENETRKDEMSRLFSLSTENRGEPYDFLSVNRAGLRLGLTLRKLLNGINITYIQ